MSRPARAVIALWALALLAVLAASPASAEPVLGLELNRDPENPVPITHSDERLAYDIVVRNTASESPSVGTELSCNIASLSGTPTPTPEYQWLRDTEPILGANASTYTITAADKGKLLQCMITATNDPDGPGGKYAPITAVAVSRPPVAVEPVPSPAPLSGTTEPAMGGTFQASRPTGTATTTAGSPVLTDVVTTEGSGELTAGSKFVENVVTTTGEFLPGQGIRSPSPGIAVGTKISKVIAEDTLELSQAATASATGVALEAGAEPFIVSHEVVGTGIPAGAKVQMRGDFTLTLSAAATASASKVPITGISVRTCAAPVGWTGEGIVWSFQWLLNGEEIPGATGTSYEVQSADTESPSQLQCRATGEDAAGNRAVSMSAPFFTRPPVPEYLNYGLPVVNASPVSFDNSTAGEVTVEVELPAGTQPLVLTGTSWKCVRVSLTCTREDPLLPSQAYPPIELIAQVAPEAPDPLVTKASADGGGAPPVEPAQDVVSGIKPAVPFGFKAFEIKVLDEADADYHEAGGHPHSIKADVEFNEHIQAIPSAEAGFRAANGSVHVVRTEAPPGFVGNPEALGEKCESIADVLSKPTTCPAASVLGGISVKASNGEFLDLPIYALEPEFGTPAQLAFGIPVGAEGFAFTLTPELRPKDGYAISLVTSPVQKVPELFEAKATLCNRGAKTEPGGAGGEESKFDGCRSSGDPEATSAPFLTLPTRCGDPASTTTRIFADSWEDPGNYDEEHFKASDLTDCESLQFAPTLSAKPTTTAADSPSGLEVDLHLPQNEDPAPGQRATATLRKAVVTLPEGLVVNPAGANGLDACSSAQIGLGTNQPPSCPNASKIGTVSVHSPVLDHPLPGTVYVAMPRDNPFGPLLALYIVVDDPRSGIVVKLPGRVDADPQSGRLTSTFDENPELPFEDLELKLRGGATAPLRTPATCGAYAVTSELTPWSAPASGPPATPSDSHSISQGAGGGNCASSPQALPHAPGFQAGTASPIAGAYSPFVVRLRREDGSQELSAVNVTPPPGLVGKLAGIAQCPDSALAAAAAKSGRDEQASPSCPAGSQVGTVTAGAGAGPAPYYATGKAYLTGPYKGAPFSLAVITPAVAGPFDVGTIVVRAAVYIDPVTALITAKSDPLPRILEGIPLDVRSVAITMDRPDFTLNPTSCNPMAVTGEAISVLGQSAPLTDRFQVGECGALKFKPNLKINLDGATKRGSYQKLAATVTYPKGPGYANIASAAVTFPHSLFLAQEHIRTICTRVQFAADQCPPGSIYGQATATTPLIDGPLSGPVYLRSSSNPLPDVVVALRGPASLPIEVELAGRVDSKNQGIRNTFELVPDAPVSKFTLRMRGGKKSLIVASRNLCKGKKPRATVRMSAHNGKRHDFRPVIGTDCRKGKQKKKKQKSAGGRSYR